MSEVLERRCARCEAHLSAWEWSGCACTRPHARTVREILYAVACAADSALHVSDFVRHADRDHNFYLNAPTATAILATDQRFCWAGKGMYGLYRHGLIPGPRKLEELARTALVSCGRSMSYEILDYCLKQMGYRYNVASLRNAVERSPHFARDGYGVLSYRSSEQAEVELCTDVPIVPPGKQAEWPAIRNRAAARILEAVNEREERLAMLVDPTRFGMSWDE